MTAPIDTTPDVEAPEIPEEFGEDTMVTNMASQYLAIVRAVADFNRKYAPKPVPANAPSVGGILSSARSEVYKGDEEVTNLVSAFDRLTKELATVRNALIGTVAKRQGVQNPLDFSTPTPPEDERAAILKRRGQAAEVQNMLKMMLEYSDDEHKNALTKFLTAHPLPVVGRNQVTDILNTTKKLPALVYYRKTADTDKPLEKMFDNISGAANHLSKQNKEFNADVLRDAHEKHGYDTEFTWGEWTFKLVKPERKKRNG